MKQTETYKLNLIETSDTFSPAPINENTQAIETQLCAARADAHSAIAGLDQRVTALEGRRFVAGVYKGSGSGSTTVTLGFTPIAVYAQPGSNLGYLAVPGGRTNNISIVENGFTVTSYLNYDGNYNYFAVL